MSERPCPLLTFWLWIHLSDWVSREHAAPTRATTVADSIRVRERVTASSTRSWFTSWTEKTPKPFTAEERRSNSMFSSFEQKFCSDFSFTRSCCSRGLQNVDWITTECAEKKERKLLTDKVQQSFWNFTWWDESRVIFWGTVLLFFGKKPNKWKWIMEQIFFFVGVDKSVSKNEKKTKKNWKEFLRNFFFSASSLLRSDVFEQDAKTFCSCEHLILTFVFHLCQSAAKKKLIIRQKRKIWKKKRAKNYDLLWFLKI